MSLTKKQSCVLGFGVYKTRLNSEKLQNFHFQAKIVIFEGNSQK